MFGLLLLIAPLTWDLNTVGDGKAVSLSSEPLGFISSFEYLCIISQVGE